MAKKGAATRNGKFKNELYEELNFAESSRLHKTHIPPNKLRVIKRDKIKIAGKKYDDLDMDSVSSVGHDNFDGDTEGFNTSR